MELNRYFFLRSSYTTLVLELTRIDNTKIDYKLCGPYPIHDSTVQFNCPRMKSAISLSTGRFRRCCGGRAVQFGCIPVHLVISSSNSCVPFVKKYSYCTAHTSAMPSYFLMLKKFLILSVLISITLSYGFPLPSFLIS